MGLINDELRSALLDLAAEATKRTSFSRQLAQQATIYDYQRSISTKITDLAGAVTPPPGTAAAKTQAAADVKIVSKLPRGHGFNPAGYYFTIDVDFALGQQGENIPSPAFATDAEKEERDDWGLHFGNPLVNPRKSTVYMVRATVSQLRVEPLQGGFILKWTKPSAWTWLDGQPIRTPVQVVSNPLVVTRIALSPSSTITKGGFSCQVVAQYP
jgi:hypothetical protein